MKEIIDGLRARIKETRDKMESLPEQSRERIKSYYLIQSLEKEIKQLQKYETV